MTVNWELLTRLAMEKVGEKFARAVPTGALKVPLELQESGAANRKLADVAQEALMRIVEKDKKTPYRDIKVGDKTVAATNAAASDLMVQLFGRSKATGKIKKVMRGPAFSRAFRGTKRNTPLTDEIAGKLMDPGTSTIARPVESFGLPQDAAELLVATHTLGDTDRSKLIQALMPGAKQLTLEGTARTGRSNKRAYPLTAEGMREFRASLRKMMPNELLKALGSDLSHGEFSRRAFEIAKQYNPDLSGSVQAVPHSGSQSFQGLMLQQTPGIKSPLASFIHDPNAPIHAEQIPYSFSSQYWQQTPEGPVRQTLVNKRPSTAGPEPGAYGGIVYPYEVTGQQLPTGEWVPVSLNKKPRKNTGSEFTPVTRYRPERGPAPFELQYGAVNPRGDVANLFQAITQGRAAQKVPGLPYDPTVTPLHKVLTADEQRVANKIRSLQEYLASKQPFSRIRTFTPATLEAGPQQELTRALTSKDQPVTSALRHLLDTLQQGTPLAYAGDESGHLAPWLPPGVAPEQFRLQAGSPLQGGELVSSGPFNSSPDPAYWQNRLAAVGKQPTRNMLLNSMLSKLGVPRSNPLASEPDMPTLQRFLQRLQ